MTSTTIDAMSWFPYSPRPHQERAVNLAVQSFSSNTVGLLSADCGIGKTIAVLSGYLASRATERSSRLFALTRTHSQSKVFETELEVLRSIDSDLAVTTMVSRVHVCPIRYEMESLSSTGFMRACAGMIRTGQCSYYWNVYKRGNSDSRTIIRDEANREVQDLLDAGVVSRERAEERALEIGFCPYELMRLCAKRSRVIIGPYGYIFQSLVREALLGSLGLSFQDIDLLVDEAHNLSSHVLDTETSKLSSDDLRWLREHSQTVVHDTGINWIREAIDFLWETIMIHLDSMHNATERVLDKWDVFPRYIDESDLELLRNAVRPDLTDPENASLAETPLDRLIDFLCTAQKASLSDGWHVTIQVQKSWMEESVNSSSYLMIQPLNSAGLIAPVLRGVRSAVLMSGTLRPLDHYARLLGVPTAITDDLSSPYPKGTRIVLIDKSLNTRYRMRGPDLWRAIADRISATLTAMPANKSALVAFPSYKMMSEVMSYSIDPGFREPIVETKGALFETVAEAIKESPRAMFCVYGGKFSEGIDLVSSGSSLIDLIIGVGIPFSPPTSYQKALQNWYDSKMGQNSGYYYAAVVPSIRQVAQLVGRLRRSPTDSGIVVLLDSRFLRYLSVFGDDIVSDVWPFQDISELKQAITQFNKMRVGISK